jgi:penicillin-binding protein 1C
MRVFWLSLCLVWLLGVSFRSDGTPLPSFAEVRTRWVPSDAYLLDRDGRTIHTLRVDSSRRRLEWTPLEQISPALIRAIIVAEDRRFYRHHGVDPQALFGALVDLVLHGRLRGASTLSMQTVGLLDPTLSGRSGARSIGQKLGQMDAALKLEKKWTKEQVLESYFNLVGFRGELQGIAAAAWGLFGKSPSGLAETEAVLLAALLPVPSADGARLRQRACAIAAAGGFRADCGELGNLVARIAASRPATPEQVALAPHLARRFLRNPGERIRTTLSGQGQRAAHEALEQQLRLLGGQNVRDGAAVAVDNRTGEILAYVGSVGGISRAPGVDGVKARRQAGSTLKPFLYGLALERRYLTAASVLEDSPANLETGSGLYVPQNYERDFKGPVSVRTALAGSLNVPAVRTLIMVGMERFRDRLWALGYEGITETGQYYGYSLALGSAEVSLLEQANAYRTLANGGVWSRLKFRPEEKDGEKRRVMNPETAFIVADILSDGAARALTFGLDNPLATRYWSAVKTGTSKNMRDNWCVGFSSRYTVAVWVGNFEGDAMQGVSGIAGAAPAWLAIMNALHGGQPPEPPRPAEGVVSREIRFEPPVESPRREWFLGGTESDVIRLVAEGERRPRIESPPGGVIISLDPDIPSENQRVLFEASGGGEYRLFLDGTVVDGGAGRAYRWLPRPGNHVLELKDAKGAVLDTVRFQVRGLKP